MKILTRMLSPLLIFTFFLSPDSVAEKVELVADINQSPVEASAGKHLTSYSNKLYFVADDGIFGEELYVYDPSTEKTTLILDINIGKNDSEIHDVLNFNDKLYFFAFDGDNHGLYEYDEVNGVKKAVDVVYYPSDLTVYQGELYFVLKERNFNKSVYVYDPVLGSVVLKYTSGSDLNFNSQLLVVEDKLYMILPWDYYGGIFVYDKQTDKVAFLDDVAENDFDEVMGFNGFNSLYNEKGKLYVSFYSHGVAVYDPNSNIISNATPNFDVENSIGEFTFFNNNIIFSSGNYEYGRKLYGYNLLTDETQLIADTYLGPYFSDPMEFTFYNNKLFFSADDGVHGKELFFYDDVKGEVTLVADLLSGVSGSSPSDFTVLNDELYFSAQNNNETKQIFKYNEESATVTSEVELTSSNTLSSLPTLFVEYNEQLYFSAFDGAETNKTFTYNTLTESVTQVSEYSLLDYAALYQNKLYVISQDKELGEGLFVFDSETNTPLLVDSIEIIGKPNTLQPIVECSDKLYFMTYEYSAYSIHSVSRLYAYDPVSNSTELITDKLLNFIKDIDDIVSTSELTVYQSKLYFRAFLSDEIDRYGVGNELYAYDCERSELIIAADIDTLDSGYADVKGSNPRGLFVDYGKLYFNADDDIKGRQFYSYDGNTQQLTVIENGPLYTHKPVIVQGKWYFATTIENGAALEVFDNESYQSTVFIIENGAGLTYNSQTVPFNLTVYNNKIYFKVQQLSDGVIQLYSYDIASEAVATVYADETGLAVNNINSTSDMEVHKNKLFFSGLLENSGYELFSLHSNHLPEGIINITGDAIEGQTLTAKINFADADGLGEISYRWYRENVAIGGAAENEYLLTSGDVNKSITAKVSYYDGEGTFEQLNSESVIVLGDNNKISSGGGLGLLVMWLFAIYAFRQMRSFD